MNKLIEKFIQLKDKQMLFVAGAAGLLYFLMFFDSGSSLSTQLDQKKIEIDKEIDKKKDTDATLKEEQRMKENIVTLSLRYQEVTKKLPSVLSGSDFSRSIDNVAKVTGARIKSKKQENIRRQDVFEEIPIGVILAGNFSQIAKFVYLMSIEEKVSRISDFTINVESQGVVAGEKPKDLVFTATVIGYRSLSDEASKAPTNTPVNPGGR